MTNVSVESLTASLVREYLSRKGLKTTLRVMDEEYPREDDSISNRQQLIKELHIDKLMKKNKETSKPLKAMLEVVAQHLMMNRIKDSGVKNGEVGGDHPRPGSTRSSLRSADSSRSQYPSADLSRPQYPTKEDTQINFDGFPASQQDDDDDLLKPDPNFTYPFQKKVPKNTPVQVTRKIEKRGPSRSNDLVIEDSHEGETVLGQGKAGVLQLDGEVEDEDQMPTRSAAAAGRPRSSAKPLSIGMSGPIVSTEDNSRRKFHKPRPLSATKNQRLNLFDNNTAPKISSLDNKNDVKSNPKPTLINSKPLSNRGADQADVREIETLVNKDRKKSIKDILEIEPDKPTSALRRQTSSEKEAKHYTVDTSSIAKDKKTGKSQNQKNPTMKVGDLEMGDIDDLDQDLSKLAVGPRITSAKINKTMHNCKPIDVKTAIALKSLIFGTPMQSFNDEWKYQSYSFCDMPKLKYGIVQKKGGPCGVLASVQAAVLQELLFGEKKIPSNRFNEPTCEERTEVLALALSKIFWRAGEKRKAVVCMPSSRPVIGSGGKFKADEFIETLSLYTFVDLDELMSFMKQTVNQFELDGQGGVVLSLYSVILSRKVEGVKEDMDQPTSKLMGAHGYCTQEMVNLFVSGHAISNVFNDVIELDSGEGNITILKGIVSRCDVGLLSLFEHYQSCQVGTYLKTPRYPVWVVCSESHFSVLFCTRKDLTSDWKAEKRFDLYYYDGLARQQEQIKLTITTNSRAPIEPPSEDELIPPLELCIRTKWEGAEVDWNGTEPLL